MKKLSLILAGAMLMMSTSAMAIPILDFGMIAPTAGTITYAGGASALIGSNISVDNVIGLGTPLNNLIPYDILNGTLNFATGNALPGATAGDVDFGGGMNDFIQLSGTIDVDGSKTLTAGDITGILFSGTFGEVDVTTTSGVTKLSAAAFTDYKLPALLAFYGLPGLLPTGAPLPYDGTFNLSFIANDADLSDGFASAMLLSGDITNSPVPEPGTMMLLGLGMLGLAVYGKRRMSKNV